MTENDRSADRARRVVQGYYETPRENVVDLLADLRHLCDADSLPWADVLADAMEHYRADVAWATRRQVTP
jgi:hypothetical protein